LEFTQLDMEMAFVDQEDVLAAISAAVAEATEAVTGSRPAEFPRMTWHEAAERFGTDKPDLRFGLELVDVGDVFAETEFRAFQAEAVKGIRVPGGATTTSRAELDRLTDRAKELGAAG